jgi:hypothetical protein
MSGPTDKEARLVVFDLTSTASTATGAGAGCPTGQTRATALIGAADGSNGATVYFGTDGSATFPYLPNQGFAVDLPPGYFIDLQNLTISGGGTSGLVMHMTAVVVGGNTE